MRIPRILLAAVVLSQAFGFATSLGAQKKTLPQLPGAVLLMGWPPYQLELTTENKVVKIQSDEGEWSITPSISADGSIVATARLVEGELAKVRVRSTFVISTYSTIDGEWTEHKDLTTFSGPVAISPDGSRLACFAGGMGIEGWRLRIIDIKTGTTKTLLNLPQGAYEMPQITWSPDSRRIAFDSERNPPDNAEKSPDMSDPAQTTRIYVMDLDSGAIQQIAGGWLPSWSPSGEWIAYFDYPMQKHNRWPMNLMVPERIILIRPDGTVSRVVGSWRAPWDDLRVAPVWSPDSRTILINRVRDEGDNMDIYLLNLATGKITEKFKKSPPVYAWIAAR